MRHLDCDYADNIDIHVTVCAHHDAPFARNVLARIVVDNIEFYCRRLAYRLYGYCLMPDHLHALLSPSGSGTPLSQWLCAFKSYTTHQFLKLGGTPPLWQRSAHDHVCRSGETAERVVRYIAENPVRAGLVNDWKDWPWTRVFVEV